jgi:hypothetical protein
VVSRPGAQQVGQKRIAHVFSFAKDPACTMIGIRWPVKPRYPAMLRRVNDKGVSKSLSIISLNINKAGKSRPHQHFTDQQRQEKVCPSRDEQMTLR